MKRLVARIGKSVNEPARSLLRSRAFLLLGCLACVIGASGCFGHVHTVGDGPQGGEVRTERIWYAGYGFIPLSRIDSGRVMGRSEDFRITTAFRASDVILNIFTGPFGFFRQTTRFEK